jgi:hypothetical protein
VKKITLLLVIIFTFLFSTTSWGEWSFGKKDKKGNTFYYDKERVRKKGGVLYFWELQDYGLEHWLKKKHGANSHTTFLGLDCSILRYYDFKLLLFTKQMGEGEQIFYSHSPGPWGTPSPNSVREEMFEEICNYDSIELRLEKLKSLLEKDLITEEEFNTKKQKLIDEI